MAEFNLDFYDPNATLDYKYDTDEVQAEIARQQLEEEEEEKRRVAEQEAATKKPAVPETTPKETTPKEKTEPEQEGNGFGQFMAGKAIDFVTTGGQETKKRVAAGTIDTVMDGLSALIPALTPAADWWDEQSGRKTETDPFKKAERDANAIIVPNLLAGGAIGTVARATGPALGLTTRANTLSQVAAGLGMDQLISGVSDTTREPGNMGDLIEAGMRKIYPNTNIPWATRDGDSPDVTYAKNMVDNFTLGGASELVTIAFALRGGNKIIPKNQKAADAVLVREADAAVDLGEAGGDPLTAALVKQRTTKNNAQIAEGQRVLMRDPEGVMGYNAFVNEPAEDVARVTMDESADAIDFMADQARIQNNVGTSEGRSRPIINNNDVEALSRADVATRESILAAASDELTAEFSLEVGGETLSQKQVAAAVNNLYDVALQSDETFTDVVKNFRNAQANLGLMVDDIADAGAREIMTKTIGRLVDAVSPYKQRASAAIQTQTAASVADLSRNIDLMDDVTDTSRLQELMMPRLRTLLKEVEVSKLKEKVSKQLRRKYQRRLKKKGEVSPEYFDTLYQQFDTSVTAKTKKVDDFVDELTRLAQDNPAYLRPLYREFARTNGEIDSLFKLNKYIDNRLGILKKAVVDRNPEIPSLLLRELTGVRMGNFLNGLAPAKAWVQNAAMLLVKPPTVFAGYVPKALQGDLKPIQKAWYQFSGGIEVFRRAQRMAADEWRFANANPDAAMARGRTDYNASDSVSKGNDYRKALNDYETFEELSETWELGRQGLWNLTKGVAFWNRKAFNRWGIHGMYSADGFLKSAIASMNSRGNAFDQLVQKNNGAISKAEFQEVEAKLYNETFDENGLIKDEFVKYQSEEIALNADVPLVNAFTTMMENIPIVKGIFMFPKTRANQLNLVSTFDPTGLLAGYAGKTGKTLRAGTREQIDEVLELHGMRGASDEAFEALKAEYIGRKAMSTGVVMSGALLALDGRLTGSGPSNPTENKKWRDLGGQPFSFNFGSDEKPDWRSYEAAPAWIKTFLGLTADITRTFSGADGESASAWYSSLALALEANVTNDLYTNEMETLHGLLSLDRNAWMKYTSNFAASMIPGYSINNTLSSILTPQLQDVEQSWVQYVANRFRWIPSIDEALADQIDIFTGQSINAGASPLEIGFSKLLPGFKTKAGNEPWREWLLSTGWSGLKNEKTNRLSKEPLTPPQRQWINSWIGKNLELDKKVEELMNWDDGKWQKNLDKYMKARGFRSQADFPVKEHFIHEYMDRMIDDAYKKAWAAYEAQNSQAADLGILKEARSAALASGDIDRATQIARQIDVLRQTVK